MCEKAFSSNLFMLKYCLDRYKTQEMCDKAVDDFLPKLKFLPDCFVTDKMIKKLYNALFADDDILFFDEDSGIVTFSSTEMGILSGDHNNINLYDTNFYEDDPKTIIHGRLLAWHNTFKQHKAFKNEISKELMLVTWHPIRWWDWCMPKK